MDIKVNQTTPVVPTETNAPVKADNGEFKFMLISNIEEADLQNKLNTLLNDISSQGERIAQHMDVRDMKNYRKLIKEFINEIVSHSHKFSRENFLDRRGRHRVYGIIKLIDKNLDELATQLMSDEIDHIDILGKIGEIQGLLLDIFT